MKIPAWLVSALTTLVVLAGAALATLQTSDSVTASAGVVAVLTMVLTVGRTVLAAINPTVADYGWTQLAGLLPAWVTSLITSLVAFCGAAALLLASGVVDAPAAWATGVAVVLAFGRTLVAAINPTDSSFGFGAGESAEDLA